MCVTLLSTVKEICRTKDIWHDHFTGDDHKLA